MGRHLVRCVVVVLMGAVPGIAADRSPSGISIGLTTITIGMSDDCGADAAVIATARAEATRIWFRADVELRWVSASQLPFASPRTEWLLVQCSAGPLQDVSSEEESLTAVASIRFLDGQPMNVITLRPHSATLLLKRDGHEDRRVSDQFPALRQLRLGRMLGRALAHEIGHFLSASRMHTLGGLMRPTHSIAAFTGLSLEPFRIGDEFRRVLSARRTVAPLSSSSPESATSRQ